MEGSTLNMILVFSFLFVSSALAFKWIGEVIIQIILAKQGLEIQKQTQLDIVFTPWEEEDEKDDR